MGFNLKHEMKNFIISAAAVILTIGVYRSAFVNHIIFNFILGMLAFKIIRQRGTKVAALFYSIFMSLIFLVLGSIYTIQSRDPFNWMVVIYGLAATFLVQLLISFVLLNKLQNQNHASH